MIGIPIVLINAHSHQDKNFSVFLNAESSVLDRLKVPECRNRSCSNVFMNGELSTVVYWYATN